MMCARMTGGVGFQPSLRDGLVYAFFPALKRRAILKRPSGAGKIRFSTEIAATQQIETERKRLTTND